MLSMTCHFIDVDHEKCEYEKFFLPISFRLFSLNCSTSFQGMKWKENTACQWLFNTLLEAKENRL